MMLKVNELHKSYGKFEAVKGITFEVEKASIYGFVGKNGAGKSTTIRCIMNLLQPSSGNITINGLDAVKDSKAIKEFSSYMPSEITYYDKLTVKEFMKFNLEFTKSSMDDVEKWASYFELDLTKRLQDLSLGNKKKVSVIIMLIKEADILIMDEPTSGLDPLMQQKFFQVMLNEKKKGKTIFLSSHNLTEIEKYCDHVAIIKDGMIVDLIDMAKVTIKHDLVVTYTTKDDKTVKKTFTKDVNDLVKELARLDLKSLEIKTKSIEDEFIKYYQEEGDENEHN